MNGPMELLAPAGGAEALRAAVCAGADAVYLGYARFGARAAAANFDAEALEAAVAYAHLYRVRVHVTVNTLVKPGEEEAVCEALRVIAACRADAVIVQDAGVLRMAREMFPALEIHASTQMGIHTAAGARFALARGARRVVLARECDLRTIAEVAATGADTEVFVHGALCASVSGQCLLSSMAGGRSGIRGRCAQPCRQPLRYAGETAAWLSTRDLCLRDRLPQLAAAGVKALKIEGRLKKPEYVAVVTESYRRALDALAKGNFAPADEQERESLLQIFQRGGFTEGHACGAQDAALCSVRRVGHGGVAIGKITAVRGGLATAELRTALHDGDGLRVEGAEDTEFRYAGPGGTRARRFGCGPVRRFARATRSCA
jgi:putative protease